MAWKVTAEEFGLKYKFSHFNKRKNQNDTPEDIFTSIAKEQGSLIDAKKAATRKRDVHRSLSSGIPIKAVLERLRKVDKSVAVFVVSSRSDEHVQSGLKKLNISEKIFRAKGGISISTEVLKEISEKLSMDPKKITIVDSSDTPLRAAKALGMNTFDVRTVFDFPSDNLGIVMWYDTTKGYGFIKPRTGGQDLFVHQSSIKASGFRFLERDEYVQYTSGMKNGKQIALNVRAPHGKSLACESKTTESTGGNTHQSMDFKF
ncbi:hypothetical protein AAMO2058_000484400 [Amorphochlora amoebiformis]